MLLSLNLSALSLRQVVPGACQAVGYHVGAGAIESVTRFLSKQFLDQSQRLTSALQKANKQAWKAMEVALAGNGFWDRCKLVLSSAEERAFREHVRPFLNGCPLAELSGREKYRADCLRELRQASKKGLLTEGSLEPQLLAKKVGAFARFTDPQAILEAEKEALAQMASELEAAGYANLASFLSLRPKNGEPLLVVAGRYFLRRSIETDEQLFRGLTFAQIESLQKDQDQGFQGLTVILESHFDRLEIVLQGLLQTVEATHDAVLDIREEQQRQGTQAGEIYEAVATLQSRLDLMHRELRPCDSLSIRNDSERKLVRELVARYRQLPEEDRQELPALLNAIGKLEVAAGEFESAQSDFATVATMVSDPVAEAEAHANAFHAALERREWDTALAELQKATALAKDRYAPFPLDKLIPQRILGAGGFGVAYLCRHRYMKTDVVVKSLVDEDLERDADALFSEAQVLRQLDHPSIIRIQDCGFADTRERRPYLVMDYFEGQTLEAKAQGKPFPVEDLYEVALQMIQGLHAAHQQSILHRDIKPANVLVQRNGNNWQIKLIDFGLALRKSTQETLRATTATLAGSSIAGTLEYAAPEQMGRLPGASITPASDIYGFARTCCYALFQTPQPLPRHWRRIPEGLADLLEVCLESKPEERPQSFDVVERQLLALRSPTTTVAVTMPVAKPKPEPEPKPEVSAPEPEAKPEATDNGPPLEERSTALEVISQEVAGCEQCPTLVQSRSHTVFGEGAIDPDICFIGEAPGGEEDQQGRPFIGPAGQLLNRIISAMGMKREEVYICNLLKCRPPNNRQPLPEEAANCRGYLDRQLELIRPKMIVALGGSAAKYLLDTQESIGRLRRRVHSYRGTPVICTYHPAFLLPSRSPEKKSDVWADMQLVLRELGRNPG